MKKRKKRKIYKVVEDNSEYTLLRLDPKYKEENIKYWYDSFMREKKK